MLSLGGWYLIVMVAGQPWKYFQPLAMDSLQDCLSHAPAWERRLGVDELNPVCLNATTREIVDNVTGTSKAGDRYVLRGLRKTP